MNQTAQWIAAFVVGAALSTALIAHGNDDASGKTSTIVNELTKGNSRFVNGKNAFPRTDAGRRTDTSKGQTPVATILTCSDSRVPPEFIFDQGIGDLFVIRVAGNVADTYEIGTIEYGVGHLKTPVLIVLGHTHCGAVKAVVQGAKVGSNIRFLVDNIVPAADRTKAAHPEHSEHELIEATVEENVLQSIQDILKRSAEVREKVAAGHLKVMGGVYDLETGAIKWIGSDANH